MSSKVNYTTKPVSIADINKQWLLIDATNCFLGRLSSKVVNILLGKNKSYYTNFFDCGDNVIIMNAINILVSGKKDKGKKYIWHTGYPGGQRCRTYDEVKAANPSSVILMAIRGMLPKNRLGRAIFKKNIRVFNQGDQAMEYIKRKNIKFINFKID